MPLGIEKQWKPHRPLKSGKMLGTKAEWDEAKQIMLRMINKGRTPPFKINRKTHKGINHSFIVDVRNGVPTLGIKSRAKLVAKGEGFLGHGANGMCTIVCWEDGKKEAIKIEGSSNRREINIMNKLGLLNYQFERSFQRRKGAQRKVNKKNKSSQSVSTQWIEGNEIKTKSYKGIDLIEGDILDRYLNKFTDPSKKLEIAISILEALKQLQNNHVVHNDLHSNNIIIDKEGRVHIIDFGKSVDLDDKSDIDNLINKNISDVLGRNDTQSPEIKAYQEQIYEQYHNIVNNPQHGKEDLINFLNTPLKLPFSFESDIYSAGVLIENMFFNVSLPERLINVIDKMKDEDPAKRGTLDELIVELKSEELRNGFTTKTAVKVGSKPDMQEQAYITSFASTTDNKDDSKPDMQEQAYITSFASTTDKKDDSKPDMQEQAYITSFRPAVDTEEDSTSNNQNQAYATSFASNAALARETAPQVPSIEHKDENAQSAPQNVRPPLITPGLKSKSSARLKNEENSDDPDASPDASQRHSSPKST